MHFYFENVKWENLITCDDVNPSGIRRFTISPVASTLLRYKVTLRKFQNFDVSKINFTVGSRPDEPYILPVGVAHSPRDWCGADTQGNGIHPNYPERQNLFAHVPEWVMEDLRAERAWLMLDQTHEGYHEDWLFDWFHNSCTQYGICPSRIIYVTGNVSVEDQYAKYCREHSIDKKMCVLGYLIFEGQAETNRQNQVLIRKLAPLPSFTNQLEYKKQNVDQIKIYNALQKRPRAHRVWFFHGLVTNGLLDHGINSMNAIEFNKTYYAKRHMTEEEFNIIAEHMPMMPPLATNYQNLGLDHFSNGDSGKFVEMFNEQIALDSWVSVVSEASFAEDTCFISEKTFKPIACSHPFIIYGNKHTLKYLRAMGYRTFHPYIDESYDELDTWDRHEAILTELKRLSQLSPRKLYFWFKSMKSICDHNSNILSYNTMQKLPPAILKLNLHITEET